MKSLVYSVVGAFVLIGFFYLVQESKKSDTPSSPPVEQFTNAGKILKGEHQLRKVAAKMNPDLSVATTSYFMFASCREGSNVLHNFSVKFSWLMNDGSYSLSSLSLDKIRVKFDESYEVPTIKFRWRPSDYSDVSYLMGNEVIYAVVTTKESDWPIPLKSLFIVNE